MADNENKTEQAASSSEGQEKPAAKKDPRDKLFKPEYDLVISSSPHDYQQGDVPVIMWNVVFALVPAALMGIYFFRLHAAMMIAAVTATAVVAEIFMNWVMKRRFTVGDGSAILTGLLLALTLPPELPIFFGMLGAAFGIIIGKQIYGGLGYNIFNPALLGRAFLQASFPVPMTTWTWPATMENVAATTAATPLGQWKFEKLTQITTDFLPMLWGNTGGSIGETSAILIFLGGMYLLVRKYADWRIPISFIGTVFLLTGILWLVDSNNYANPVFHVLSGGLMLGAFFMATDMVTSPITPRGAWIFGAGTGLVLVVIRVWGGLPEGVMYSIIFMNSFVPLINRYTRPRYLGEVKK